MFIGNARRFEFIFEFSLVDMLEQLKEAAVILLEDRVLGAQIHRPAKVQTVVQRGAGEVDDGFIKVVHPHHDTGVGGVEKLAFNLCPVFADEFQGQLALAGKFEIGRFILVTIGMTAHDNRLGPTGHKAGDVLTDDRLAENHAAQNVTDRPVGGAPHLFQAEFLDPSLVRGDGRAFDANAVFLDRMGRVYGDLVVGLVADLHPQIVILQIHIEIGKDQLFLNEIPHDAGHLITVELNDRVFHFDLGHHLRSFEMILTPA